MEEKKIDTDSLESSVIVLKELQLSLEPIRDKALDEKARLTGYAQCAEQMIKIIVAKMLHMEELINEEKSKKTITEKKKK